MKSARFEMKVPEELLGRVDRWRGQQSDVPNRSEAIRRLIEAGLRAGDKISIRRASPTGGAEPGSGKGSAPPSTKPTRQTAPARPLSKEAQIRALREQQAR